MQITIKEVTTRGELKEFIAFFTHLYKDNKQVAFPLHFDEMSTLRADKNPAHEFCQCKYWLALKGDTVVGRIAAIINHKEQQKIGEKIGRFGWFDFEDDGEVSSALINTAITWLKEQKIEKVHGPMGFTDMDRQGLLIEGYDRAGTMATIYNYPYYEKHLTNLGFKKSTDWIEYQLDVEPKSAKRLEMLSQRVMKNNNLRSLKPSSRKQLKKMAPEIFTLINEAYKDLYGYIALTPEQIKYYTEAYLSFVNFNLISLVVDPQDKLVGVGICMTSFTNALQKAKGKLFPLGALHMLRAMHKNDTMDLYLIAVDAKYQSKGVNAIIMSDVNNGALKMGITKAETNIELEDNEKVQSMWKMVTHTQHKRRRCYIKEVNNE